MTPDFVLDKGAYEAYSPVYLPITYVLSYAVQFASLSALVTHTACWHGRDIWKQSKLALRERHEKEGDSEYHIVHDASRRGERRSAGVVDTENMMSGGEDVHCRLMRRYEDAPMHWYLVTFIAMLAIGIFVVEYNPVHLPWYGLLLALGISLN